MLGPARLAHRGIATSHCASGCRIMWHGLFGSSWAVGVSSTCIKRLETTAARAVVAFRWLPRITPPLPPMSACNRLIPLRSLQLLGRQAFCPALRGMAVTVGAHRRSWSVPVANGLFPRFSSTGATTVQSIPEFGMKDKIVLITGGARGLGFTQAKGLIEAGAKGAGPTFSEHVYQR